MDLSPGLRVARGYWHLILLAGLLAAIVGFAASFAVSPSYLATSSVLVRGRDGRVLSSTGQGLGPQSVGDSAWAKSLMQTYGTLIHGREIAEQVVRELGLDLPRPPETSWWKWVRSEVKAYYRIGLAYLKHGYYAEPPAFEGAVDTVQRNIAATPVKDSMILVIGASADDPELAAAIANTATRTFIQTIDLRSRAAAEFHREYLRQQVEAAKGRLAEAEEAVRRHKEQSEVADVAEQARLNAVALDQNRRDQNQLDVSLADARARTAKLRDTLVGLEPSEQSNVRTQSDGRTLAESRIQGDVRSESGTTTTTESTNPNRLYQEMWQALATAEAELAGLEARSESLQSARARLVAQAAALPAVEARYNALRADVQVAQERLRDARTQHETAQLADSRGAQEVLLIDTAAQPAYPEKPLRHMYALVGLVCGLLAAVVAALILDGIRVARTRRERALLRLPAPAAVSAYRGVASRSRVPGRMNGTAATAARGEVVE
jgi:polysaccharide biosynthesis transport protein